MSHLLNSASFLFEQGVKEITPDTLQEIIQNRQTDDRAVEAANLFLERYKLLSQLIAKSYLPGGEWIRSILIGNQAGIRELLVNEGIVADADAEKSRFDVDPQPPGPPPFVGSVDEDRDPETEEILIWKIPFPPRATDLTDEQLTNWCNSSSTSPPWEPYEFSQWIPYTC